MAVDLEINSGNAELNEKTQQWLLWDKNDETRTEILNLMKESKWDKLSSVMLSRLEFGTAGLRGEMKAGFCCMNQLVVLQSAQGLCEYLKKVCTPAQLSSGLVVGYDGRYNSKKFAELTAKVFVSSKIPVCLFSEVCPTPWVSFSTRLFGAAAGVMVTASHNPKQDNGYKVYWGNGAQIIRPHDKNIEISIKENLEVPSEHWDTENIRSHPLVTDRLEEVTREYLTRLSSTISVQQLSDIQKADLSVTYSAMHGVGYPYVEKAFAYVGLKPLIVVSEQQYPDPEFPTVTFPNPEEPSSLQIGQAYAQRNNCTILLANDPDADRLAVAEYQTSTGSWHILTGNEAGSLLGWWCLRNFLSAHPNTDPSSLVLMASAVSSKMLRAVAKQYGATFMETLTGFKWMGNKAIQLLSEGRETVFAFEEAIGFMCGSEVPDKDGVSAAVHFASLGSYLKLQGKSLIQQLDWLYSEYGFHITNNSYYICHQKPVMKKIFQDLRNYTGSDKYPSTLRSWSIASVRDLGLCGEEGAEEGTGLDKKLSSGEMLTISFDNGLVATIRTSGTEPKVKYYTEMCAQPGQSDREEIKKLLNDMVAALVEDFLRPKANGLIERKK